MESIKEWLQQAVPPEDMSALSGGALFIEINKAEELLDKFDSWSTQNFNYYLYKGEGYGNMGIAASLELVVEFTIDMVNYRRTFVGACNFSQKSIAPNTHWMATAKSECVKNAMSDLGKRLGRGMNAMLNVVPDKENEKEANGGVEMPTDFSNIKLKTNATKI